MSNDNKISGIFIKSKGNIFWSIAGIAAGVFLLVMIIFVWFADKSSVAADDYIAGAFFVAFCVCDIALSILLLFLNHGAYLKVNGEHLSAKYSWGKKLELDISDISFVNWQTNSLIIKEKNGKSHQIINISNSYEICYYIRRKIKDDVVPLDKNSLLKTYFAHKKQRKTSFIIIACGFAIIIALFAAFGVYTGDKSPADYSVFELVLFIISCVIFLACCVFIVIHTKKANKLSHSLSENALLIRKLTVETTPLPLGNVLKVFGDNDYFMRLCILDIPNDGSKYYIAEAMDNDFKLNKIETSNFLDGQAYDELLEEMSGFYVEISDKFNL